MTQEEKICEIVAANVEEGKFSMMLTEQGIKHLATEFDLTTVDDFKAFFLNEVSVASVSLDFPMRFGCPRAAKIESAIAADCKRNPQTKAK